MYTIILSNKFHLGFLYIYNTGRDVLHATAVAESRVDSCFVEP